MQLTDQEILQDAIVAHKFLMNMYCQFGLECSNATLRNLFEELHKVASEHNFKIFKIMNDKGYYPTMIAPTKEVKTTLKNHTQMQEELSGLINDNM